jgi:hypothetical protein
LFYVNLKSKILRLQKLPRDGNFFESYFLIKFSNFLISYHFSTPRMKLKCKLHENFSQLNLSQNFNISFIFFSPHIIFSFYHLMIIFHYNSPRNNKNYLHIMSRSYITPVYVQMQHMCPSNNNKNLSSRTLFFLRRKKKYKEIN